MMHACAVIASPQKSPIHEVPMRDLNQVADKIAGLWNTGRMNKPVQPKPVVNTTEKIAKVMNKLTKGK